MSGHVTHGSPAMRVLRKIAAAVLLASLIAASYGLWATYQPPPPELAKQESSRQSSGTDPILDIDQRTLRRAQRLSSLASAPEELPYAQAAVKLADHDLDVAFAAALRHIEAHPPVLSQEAQKLADRLQKSQKQLESDQAQVNQLTAALAQPGGTQNSTLQDRLDLAQSQLELDKDEVEVANQDLMQAGGNVHQRIQKMMQEHAAGDENRSTPKAAAADPLSSLHGLVERVREWLTLRKKERYLQHATAQATSSASELWELRQQLVAQLEASKSKIPGLAHSVPTVTAAANPGLPATGPQTAGPLPPRAAIPTPVGMQAPGARGTDTQTGANVPNTLLATTRQLAADQKLLTSFDQRIADRRQLADVYGKWNEAVATQAKTVLHTALSDLAIVIVILLLLLFADQWLERLVGRMKLDRRQVETLRSVTRVALQILSIVVILVMLIGMPTQLGTMLGIVGAGLTVALKDFIVAFIGWLVLMGKNGMRLGDWVEINGVSGEVIQLGMFHTVLLETGNWTDAGHPTGRRVTFTNSFAISGHYFNFSTSGQWLWDEVLVLVPYERDPTSIADSLYKEVVNATGDSSRQAEVEWKSSGPTRRGMPISATPGLSIRPAVGGIEVAVRYVTRAGERFNVRARLYKTAVSILGQSAQPRSAAIAS
jgi:small-conductance mechanosensitive channel